MTAPEEKSKVEDPEHIRELLRGFCKALNEKRPDLAEKCFQDDCLLHYGSWTGAMRSEGKMILGMWLRGFPDFAFEVKDIVVDGNRGAMRLTFTGTQTGEFLGLAPTGKRIQCTESLFVLVRDGKIAEAWEDYDELGMWRQLGLKLPKPS